MAEIRIAVPRLPKGLLPNLLGLLGLVAVAVAVGALVGNWWWSVLAGGVFAVGLAYLTGASADDAGALAEVKPVRPVAVARSA